VNLPWENPESRRSREEKRAVLVEVRLAIEDGPYPFSFFLYGFLILISMALLHWGAKGNGKIRGRLVSDDQSRAAQINF
jgi:hypothetical protein